MFSVGVYISVHKRSHLTIIHDAPYRDTPRYGTTLYKDPQASAL